MKKNGNWRFDVSQDETGQKVHEIIGKILKVKRPA